MIVESSRRLFRCEPFCFDLVSSTVDRDFALFASMMQRLVCELGLAEETDRRLHVLKLHLPYHESDRLLNFAA